MPRNTRTNMDNDIEAFSHTAPPPPYPGSDQNTHSGQVQYDLTPTPHSLNRPRLPEDKRNQFLVNLPEDVTVVKFQTIVREGKEIVVGRIKVPIAAANRHAFILRRYDTNAISLTTMFKVAFPGASEEDEKREMSWVESTYDTRNTNGGRGSSDVRLAGQWVSGHLAIHLAPAYGISNLVTALARAVPDPTVVYHKSRRSQAAAEHIARGKTPPAAVTPTPIVPSMSSETTPAPKRVRRQSPRVNRPTASSNDQSAAEEDTTRHLTLEATTTVTAPANANVDMDAEIQSAKQLVMDLKRELQLRASVGEELEDQGYVIAENSRGVKRGKGEDDGVSISGGSLVKDRLVRKNKRVVADGMTQTAKRVAWGALIFGLGVGAASLIPQFASSFL